MADLSTNWDVSPEDLADDLERLVDAVRRNVVEALETWALMVESTAKQLCPVDEGRLRSSISNRVRQVSQQLIEAHIGTNVPYAPYVEEGRGPIRASGDGVLHFTINGEDIFVKEVGPAEAQPFLAPAIETHISDVEDLLREAVEDAAAEVGAT